MLWQLVLCELIFASAEPLDVHWESWPNLMQIDRKFLFFFFRETLSAVFERPETPKEANYDAIHALVTFTTKLEMQIKLSTFQDIEIFFINGINQ